jgi:methylated-DNA-[protein]-cysteine S-methyltransferase
MTVSFTLFDTAIGRCAIAWGPRGIACVQLPEANEPATRARVFQRFPRAREVAPPSEAERARDRIVAYLRGEPGDLASVPLDMELVPPFHRRVYEAARGIPWGATMTYGALAAQAGAAGSARAVGQALARNPFAIIVPCHRVGAAGGRIGGFSANGGTTTKLRLLAIEGHKNSAPEHAADRALA